MSTTVNRSLAVMNLPKTVPARLKFAAALVAALTNNAFFPNAAPIVAALAKALTAADAAETATKTRARGTVATRNAALKVLLSEMHAAKAFIQQAADADPDHADGMITSAGLSVRKSTTRHKAPFTAEQGSVSGSVKLVARAAAIRASYDWGSSVDGGKTWTELPSTLQAKTTLAGIVPGTSAQFRFRSVTKAGQGDWSQPAALLVK